MPTQARRFLTLLASGTLVLACGNDARSGVVSGPDGGSGAAGNSAAGGTGRDSAAGGTAPDSAAGGSVADSAAGGSAGIPTQDGGGPCVSPGPCLIAERNWNGSCVPRALDDGTPCEDGDACTDNDRCQGGVCIGSAIKQQPSLRGEVQAFGASPGMNRWNEGVAAFMSPGRLVFLESKSYTDSVISLVQVDGQGLTRLATATSQTGYFYDINWVYRPETHIVPLTPTDFVVVDGHDAFWGTPRNIEIFEIVNDTLVSHGFTRMPDDGPLVFGAAGRQDTLWVCGPGELDTYDFDTGSKQLKLAARLALGAGEGCNALALSPDARTLFMATKGARVIDVSGDPKPGDAANNQVPEICPAGTQPRDPASTVPETCAVLSAYTLSDVQVSADHLAALTTDNVGDMGSALVVSTHDSNVVKIMQQDALSDAAPIALGLAENRLFVEWWRPYTSSGWPSTNVAIHPLDTDSTKPLAELAVRDDCCGGEPWTLLSFVANGNLAVLQPWRRVVRFDEAIQELGFVTGTEHGSLKTLVPSTPTEVVAVGPYESHWIDISAPDSPRIVSGGMNLSPGSADFQLLTPNLGVPPALANTPPGHLTRLTQKSPRERFSILDTSAAPRAIEIGSFWIAGEPSNATSWRTQIAASRGQIFQIHEETASSFHIRRYEMNSGIGLDVQELSPDLDVVFEVPAATDLQARSQWAFGVNDSGTELLIVERRFPPGTADVVGAATWLSVGTQDVSILAQGRLPQVTIAQNVVLAGDQALVVDYNFAGRLHRMGSSVVEEAYHPMVAGANSSNPLIERILAFDGSRAALSVHHWTQALKSQYSVEILDGADLSVLASYDTSEEVQSMLVVGTNLVFGMNSAVSVAAPYCP